MSAPAVSTHTGRWTGVAAKAWRAQGGFLWVAAGRAGLVGANAVLLLVLARIVAPEGYGLFTAAIGAQAFLSRILLLGLDTGVMRLAAAPGSHYRAGEVISAGFRILGAASALLFGCSLLAIPVVLLWQPGWPWWAPVATVAGAAGTALVDYGAACRLAQLRYARASLVQGGAAVARLICAAGVAAAAPNAALILLAYTGATFACGLLQSLPLPFRAPLQPGSPRRLLQLSARVAISDILVVLSLHQGSFLLLLLGQRAELGLFGLALSLSLGGRLLGQSFFQTILPKFARIGSVADLPRFIRRSLEAAAVLTAMGIAGILAAGWLVPRLVRPEFFGAVPVFYWLGASVLITWLQYPLVSAALYLLRPGFLVAVNFLRVVLIACFGFALAPAFGAIGAAAAQFAGAALASAALVFLVWSETRAAVDAGREGRATIPQPASASELGAGPEPSRRIS